MRIVGTGLIIEFIQRYPDSRSSLTAWKQLVEVNNVKHFNELKQIFSSADYVRPYTVFNIAGNKYRLVALINFQIALVAVEYIFTHSEYDKGKWRK
jgi:mRNA interferase HigB